MNKYIIANWKMNLSIQEAMDFCKQLTNYKFDYAQILIASPNIYLSHLSAEFSGLQFCAQDVSAINCNYGPFTGEVSAKMLKDIKINHCIVGHSERVINFREKFIHIKNKVINCLNNDVNTVICFGESLLESNKANILKIIENKVSKILELLLDYKINVSDKNCSLILAYEPIWAIGSNLKLDITKLKNTISFIKKIIVKFCCLYQDKYKHNIENIVKLVYGGSVNVENAQSILMISEIDGLLVGNSSLNVNKFIEICKKVKKF